MVTPVANLSNDIDAAADEQELAQGMSAVALTCTGAKMANKLGS